MNAIDEIKSRIAIEDLAGNYAQLKASGKNFKACCPFHKEKTPSFFVFPDKGSWHCFGSCNTGGDIFTFLEKAEGISFKEALERLAGKAGIQLPDKQDKQEAYALIATNNVAAKYFQNQLDERGLKYLRGRGFTDETIAEFELGMSGELHKYMAAAGYSNETLLKVGLIIKNGREIRDLFQNRIMIPIKDAAGNIIAFSGRAMGTSKLKYLNTSQTVLFSKRSTLWGLDKAKDAIKELDFMVLVEGYFDVMMAHQLGFDNTVCLMGSGITPEHIIVMKKYTRNIYLALDPDEAGKESTLRSIKIARRIFSGHAEIPEWLDDKKPYAGDLKIISLPAGMDPDEFILNNPDDWEDAILNAKSAIDHLFDSVLARIKPDNERNKASIAEQLMPVVKEIEDAVEQELYVRKLADILNVSPETLRTAKYKTAPRIVSQNVGVEEHCLAILLQHSENSEIIEMSKQLMPRDFTRTENQEVLLAWRKSIMPDEVTIQRQYEKLLSVELVTSGAGTLADCIRYLKEQRLKADREMLTSLLKEATDPEEKKEIIGRIDEINVAAI